MKDPPDSLRYSCDGSGPPRQGWATAPFPKAKAAAKAAAGKAAAAAKKKDAKAAAKVKAGKAALKADKASPPHEKLGGLSGGFSREHS